MLLGNSGTTGTGFESDNHSILSLAPTAPGTPVFVQSFTNTPEPSTLALLGLPLLVALGGRRKFAKS